MAAGSRAIAGIFSKIVHTVTAEGIGEFRDIVNDDDALSRFFGNPSGAVEFLEALTNSGPEAAALAAKALAVPDAVFALSENGQADAVQALQRRLQDQTASIATFKLTEISPR